MQQLIQITTNEQGSKVVSARELYDFLGFDSANWKRWSIKNIENNQFAIENQDWVGFFTMKNGNETKDYALSIDFSKRLCQMAKTAKGEEIRNYFIECEKELFKPKTSMEVLADAVLLAQQVIAEKDQQIKQLAPKAEYTDKVLQSSTTLTTTEVAKDLKITAIKLNEFLCEQKVQTKHRDHYVLLAKYQGKGYERMTTQMIVRNNEAFTKMQLEWTERGRAFIHYLYNQILSFSKAPMLPVQGSILVSNV